MEKIKINIDFYSDILEDDIVLDLNVNYETEEEIELVNTGVLDNEVFLGYNSLFVPSDVTILNDVSFGVRVEFFDKFENHEKEIREAINNEINE